MCQNCACQQANTKTQILKFLNELIWYTKAIAKDYGCEVPSLKLSPREMETLLTQKYWLLWDIKNYIEEELKNELEGRGNSDHTPQG